MLHFDFRAGYHIIREGISRVWHVRRTRQSNSRIDNSGVLRSRERSANFFGQSGTNGGHQLARQGENRRARTKSLLFPFHFGFDLNSRICLLSVQHARICQDSYLKSGRFWNTIDAITKIPLPANEQVPKHLHKDYARRSIDRTTDGTIQPGKKNAVDHFFPADSLEIRPGVLTIE